MRATGQIHRRGYARTAGTFLLGAAVGSIAAVLTAPASGEVTRRRLLLRARNAERALARKLGRARTVLIRRAERTRNAANHWITEHVMNGQAKRTNGHGRRPVRRRVAQHA